MMQLRPYQADIIDRASRAKGSVLIEAPTGAGKSVMAKFIARNEIDNGGTVLIVAPKITLIEQLTETFADLAPQVIHGGGKYDSGHNVFISTLQTAHRRKLGFIPTLIMVDEVHHGFTGKMIEQLLKDFDGKLIGLSATPYDKQGKRLQGFDLHIDDYDMRYMIGNGYLVPPVCYAPVKVDLSGIRTTAGDYNQSDLDAKFNTIESVMQVVDSTKEMVQSQRQAIVFCITINHAEAMACAFNDAGISAAAMHSQLTSDEREKRMAAFKRGDLKLLTNPDMLTTGFNHPPTDTVVLARATKSQNLYRQMVGRVLRLSEDKDEAVVLDCAGVIDELGLPTEPIKELHKGREKKTAKKACRMCGSDRVYRRAVNDSLNWQCLKCGYAEQIEPKGGYECGGCGVIHEAQSEIACIAASGGKLYLRCACGHETLISEATRHDELQAIFDHSIVKAVRERVTVGYMAWLVKEHGADFITRHEVVKHIQALQRYLSEYPHIMPNFSADQIQPDGWRLIPSDYKFTDSETIKEAFYGAQRFKEAVALLDQLLKINGKPPLKTWVIEKTLQQIKDSPVNNIERITVKRLKNLYSNGKDCNSIDAFIPYIESTRKSK